MQPLALRSVLGLTAWLVWGVSAPADDVVGARRSWSLELIEPTGIGGSFMLHGGGEISDEVRRTFVQLAGGGSARVVIVTRSASRRDMPENCPEIEEGLEASRSLTSAWSEFELASLELIRARQREETSDDSFLLPLQHATGVWFEGDHPLALEWRLGSDAVKHALSAVLDRGGVIGGERAVAALAESYTFQGEETLRLRDGLGLLPQVLITHEPPFPRESIVSLFVEPETTLVLHQRKLGVLGEGSVIITPYHHVSSGDVQLKLGRRDTADYTALRRMACLGARYMRTEESPVECTVPSGALMIVGGGAFTSEMCARFVELAGGESARIVIIPTAEENPRLERRGDVRQFFEHGAVDVTVLHTTDRRQANSEEFVRHLREATGVWFGGGRQWRLLDAYSGTLTEHAIREVLDRGGVIGGSSAGATIQGDYLVRGNPLGNLDMMSAGYEDGFAYLPGSAIDQHFTQRGRQPDMVRLKTQLPHLLGVGIDESTALVVAGATAEVLGAGSVYFYDGHTSAEARQFTAVPTGRRYHLMDRRLIDD